jgi:hypothetical protein
VIKRKRVNKKIEFVTGTLFQEFFDFKIKSQISFELSHYLYKKLSGSLIKNIAEAMQ